MSQFCQDFTKQNISRVFKNFHNSKATDSKINYNIIIGTYNLKHTINFYIKLA